MKKILCKIIIVCFITQILSTMQVFAMTDNISLFGVGDKFAHVWDGTADTSFEGGTGTESDPYQIATPEQLAYLRDTVNAGESYEGKYFILTQDLKMNKDEFFIRNKNGIVTGLASNIDRNNAYGWIGIGVDTFDYFSGVFDGQGHIIKNLYGTPGLFYSVKNATLRNITVDGYIDDRLSGVSTVGGLLAQLNMYDDSSIIENCINKCYCKGDTVGGIIGKAYGGSREIINNNIIKNCINYGIIEGHTCAGGIVGLNRAEPFAYGSSCNIDIISCGNYGDVTSMIDNRGKGFLDLDKNSHAGGIVGINEALYSDYYINTTAESNIKNCFNYGNITLLGYGDENYINYNYVSLSVGGIAGTNDACVETSNSKATATIDSCYNAGIVKGYSANSENIQIGGIVGYNHSDSSWYVCGGGDDASGSFFHNSDTDADTNRYSKAIIKNCFNVGLIEDTTTFEITRDLLAPVTSGNTEDGHSHGHLIGNCCGGIVGKNLTETYAANAYAEIYNNYNRAKILDKGQTNSGNVLGKTVSYKIGITSCIENNSNFTIRNELAENKIENNYYMRTQTHDEYALGLSDSAMQNTSSYNGFDFSTVWEIDNSSDYPYPTLRNVPFYGVLDDGLTENDIISGTFGNTNSTSDGAPIINSVSLKDSSNVYDIMEKAVNIQEDSPASVDLSVDVDWNGNKNGKIHITQGTKTSLEVPGGKLTFKPGEELSAGKTVYILAIDEETGKSTSTKVKLMVNAKNKAEWNPDSGTTKFNFKLGKSAGFTIPDSVMFPFGGMEIDFGLDIIPITFEYENENKINIAFGIDSSNVDETTGRFKGFNFADYKATIKSNMKKSKEGYTTAKSNKQLVKELKKKYPDMKFDKVKFNVSSDIDTNTEVTGYAEMNYVNGNWVFSEGYIALNVEVSYEHQGQVFIWVVPCYYEFGGKFGGSIEGTLKNISFEKFQPTLEGYVSAKVGASIGGGVGVAKVCTFGASGEGSLNIKTALHENYLKAWGEGDADFKVKVLGKTVAKKNFAHGEFTIYETGNKHALIKDKNAIELSSIDDMYDTMDGDTVYPNEPREYAQNPSEWLGEETQIQLFSTDYTNKNLNKLADNIYTEAKPQICEVDGKKIMIMQWDNTSRADADRTMLVYSVYDKAVKTWSAPQAVADDGTADFYPCFNGGYLVWQNEKTTLTDDMTLTDIAKLGEICVSKWNGKGFDTPVALTDNDTLDTQPSVAKTQNGASVAWTTNTENDIMGITGKNAIVQADFNGTAWSSPREIKSKLNAVTNITAGTVNNKFCVAYVCDDDNDLNTINDRDIRIISSGLETQLTNNNVLDSNPVFANNMIYYYRDGNIVYSDIDGKNENSVFAEPKPGLTDTFVVNSNSDGDTAIWWTKAENNGAEVYASLYTDGEWSDEIKVTKVGNRAKYPSGILNDDGSMIVAFNNGVEQENQIVKTDLYTISVNPSYDLELTNAYFDEGTMTAYATVKNNGELAVDSYTVELGDSKKTVSEPLKAGESVEVEIKYDKSANLSAKTISMAIAMVGGEEYNKDNNSAEFEIGHADIEVGNVAVNEDETTVSADISNVGYDNARNVTVQLRDNSADGAVIAEKIVNLNEGAKESVEFAIDKSDMRFFDASKQLYVTAQISGDEVSLGNNDGYVVIMSASGAADYETEILSYNAIDGKYVINSVARNNTDKAVSCIMYSAVYSEDGTLKACGTVKADIDADNDTGVDITVPCTIEKGDTVKIFMWTDKTKPLAKTGEWKKTN